MIQNGLIALNIFAFVCMGLDKALAIKHRWRLSEKFLLSTALLGGSLGTLAGIFVFRHKTRKMNFMIGVPIMLITHILILWYLYT